MVIGTQKKKKKKNKVHAGSFCVNCIEGVICIGHIHCSLILHVLSCRISGWRYCTRELWEALFSRPLQIATMSVSMPLVPTLTSKREGGGWGDSPLFYCLFHHIHWKDWLPNIMHSSMCIQHCCFSLTLILCQAVWMKNNLSTTGKATFGDLHPISRSLQCQKDKPANCISHTILIFLESIFERKITHIDMRHLLLCWLFFFYLC